MKKSRILIDLFVYFILIFEIQFTISYRLSLKCRERRWDLIYVGNFKQEWLKSGTYELLKNAFIVIISFEYCHINEEFICINY